MEIPRSAPSGGRGWLIQGVEVPNTESAAARVAGAEDRLAPAVRLLRPERRQVRFVPASLDSLVADDHPVRGIWEFVTRLDLSPFHARVGSVEGQAGRPAIDPAVLLSLWVYAIRDGVGSARRVAALCEEHVVYRWICGGVSVTRTPLSEFRTEYGKEIDELLTQIVGVLMAEGLVTLDRTAQDGMRVRASAGAPSFRRRRTLERCLREAQERVTTLREELDDDPSGPSRREKEAQARAAEDRARRVETALSQWEGVRKRKKVRDEEEAEEKVRVSTTDPDARVMKMADGGFRPAFNVQLTATAGSQVVVGVDVTNSGGDLGQMTPMLNQLDRRYGVVPKEHLVDGGFSNIAAIRDATRRGCTIYAPEAKPRGGRKPGEPVHGDAVEVAEWRRRMQTDEAKRIYRERSATIECTNGLARNRGLLQFAVRGIGRVRAVATLYAVAHNILRSLTLPGSRNAGLAGG